MDSLSPRVLLDVPDLDTSSVLPDQLKCSEGALAAFHQECWRLACRALASETSAVANSLIKEKQKEQCQERQAVRARKQHMAIYMAQTFPL